MAKVLSRDAILSADDLKTERVGVPEWGGEVIVRTMTGAERDRFEASLFAGAEPGKERLAALERVRARLLVLALADEEGKRLFAEGDIEALAGKSAAVLDRLFAVAQRLNGLSPGDVEDLAKN